MVVWEGRLGLEGPLWHREKKREGGVASGELGSVRVLWGGGGS
jgi:hypothetical protein